MFIVLWTSIHKIQMYSRKLKISKKKSGLTIMQMFEYHAICPEEMTTFMRLKIRDNHILFLRIKGKITGTTYSVATLNRYC